MTKKIAVVAHAGKTLEGGLPQLRRSLAEHGVEDPMWAEVPKSREAPKQVKRFLKEGAEHFFVWGGDGMAQRCIDTLAGSGATVAIIPAGTANLLASNLGLPTDHRRRGRERAAGPAAPDRRGQPERRAVRRDGRHRL